MIKLNYDHPDSIKKLEEFILKHIEMGEINSHISDQAKYHPDFYMSLTTEATEKTINKVFKEQGRL